jgi:HAD superfamily hydrolase (TIGR01509 family)
VALDFDGVVLDTETDLLRCWQQEYAARNVPFAHVDYERTLGSPGAGEQLADDLCRRAGGSPADTLRTVKERHRRRSQELDAMPGVRALVRSADRFGVPLALVSGSSAGWIDHHLRRLELSAAFSVTLCAEDLPARKPDPAAYAAALRLLGVHSGSAIAVEDSQRGFRAAATAGIRCFAVPGPATMNGDFTGALAVLSRLPFGGVAELAARSGLRLPTA